MITEEIDALRTEIEIVEAGLEAREDDAEMEEEDLRGGRSSPYHDHRAYGEPYHPDQAEQNPLQDVGLLPSFFTVEPGDDSRRGDGTAHECQR